MLSDARWCTSTKRVDVERPMWCRHIQRTAVVSVMSLCGIYCGRESPPEIGQFVPPVRAMIADEEPASQPVAAVAPPAVDLPAPEPASQPASAPVSEAVASQPQPEPEPEVVAPMPPSIVGAWQVTEMTRQGRTEAPPAGMQMTWTFAEDGTLTTSMSGGPQPGPQEVTGTYVVADSSITLTMRGETKTGTLAFEGADRLTIEVDDVRMVLTRQ